uniref:protein-tyrosine-phosphatase n=1 Tax=Steinernema glaseri TaxID=37863 RepID=A0A1I8AD81_9BILA
MSRVVRGSKRLRLPSVLQRRLQSGTLTVTSLSSQLTTNECKVILVPDSIASSSVASKVYDILAKKDYSVAFLAETPAEIVQTHPDLIDEVDSNDENIMNLSREPLPDTSFILPSFAAQNRDRRKETDLFPVQILPYLYLGNADTAANRQKLDAHGIRFIVNVTSNLANTFEEDSRFHYLKIAVDDTCSHNLAAHFDEAIQFIDEARAKGSAVLVHCLAGISRSVTICLAYLMHTMHSSLEDAFDLLLKRNGMIAPNFHFMGQLTDFERQLVSAHGAPQEPSSSCSNTSFSSSSE